MPAVNPDILLWARETAGLDRAAAARKIGLGAARGVEPADRLAAMERGEASPSRAQLVRMARTYHRPLVAFYLPAPPPRGDRGADFRTTTLDAPPEEQAWLDTLIREIQARHDLVRAALEEDDEALLVPFIGRSHPDESIETLCRRLIELLDFDREEFRRQRSLTDAFDYLRGRVEEAGVFTLLIGDLGSHHTAMSVDTFRGYALADAVAPMIVVNDRDARGAWSFTLLHELCHLMLGATGVSSGYGSQAIERVCNDVSSGILLDEDELDDIVLPLDEDVSRLAAPIAAFARTRNLSRTLVAYRLLRSGRLAPARWTALSTHFRQQWLEHRERERLAGKESEGGPTYYVVKRHRLGPALVETVSYLLRSGGVSVVKAAKILGVKPNNVRETLAAYGG